MEEVMTMMEGLIEEMMEAMEMRAQLGKIHQASIA